MPGSCMWQVLAAPGLEAAGLQASCMMHSCCLQGHLLSACISRCSPQCLDCFGQKSAVAVAHCPAALLLACQFVQRVTVPAADDRTQQSTPPDKGSLPLHDVAPAKQAAAYHEILHRHEHCCWQQLMLQVRSSKSPNGCLDHPGMVAVCIVQHCHPPILKQQQPFSAQYTYAPCPAAPCLPAPLHQ